jgi:GTP-binding protein HflX
MRSVERVLRDLGAADKPMVIALNKTDRLAPADLRARVAEVGQGVAISALHSVGLINLLRTIGQRLPTGLVRVRLTVPYARAGALAQIFAQGRVLKQDYRPDGVRVLAELPRVQADQLKSLIRRP